MRLAVASSILRAPARSRAVTMRATQRTIVDAHVHVWPDASTFAYEEGKTPPCAGSHDRLIEEMELEEAQSHQAVYQQVRAATAPPAQHHPTAVPPLRCAVRVCSLRWCKSAW